MMRSALLPIFVAFCVPACGGAPPDVEPAPAPTPEPAAGLENGRWGVFRSKRFDIELSLPDGKSWTIDDTREPWLRAEHAPSASTLYVRRWSGQLGMNAVSCEQRAREWLPSLPAPEDVMLVEETPLPIPHGYDTVMRVGIVATDPDAPVTGVVFAFGGWARGCFGYAFITTQPTSEEVLAGRLAAMAESLVQLRISSELDGPSVTKP